MNTPHLTLKVGDRLCSWLVFKDENKQKKRIQSPVWVIVEIEISYRSCVFKGSTERYCPCSLACSAFAGKVTLQQDDSPKERQISNVRDLLNLIREKRMWHVDSPDLSEHANLDVQIGGAR